VTLRAASRALLNHPNEVRTNQGHCVFPLNYRLTCWLWLPG
jgi:hypothetical protein